MPDWRLAILEQPDEVADALAKGLVLALDVDPRVPRVVFTARQPGLGNAEVGQRALFRQWLASDGASPPGADEVRRFQAAILAELQGDEGAQRLMRVSTGYRRTRHWTGDEIGDWTRDAWDACHQLLEMVMDALDGVPPPPSETATLPGPPQG